MNQHPKARDLGILNGTFYVDNDGDLTCPCDDTLFGSVTGSAHMRIAADALNTTNTHGHTPSEMVAIIRELRALIDVARYDMWQTARVNQSNLTGVDLCIPKDDPCIELIGNHHVTQAGVDGSLFVIRKIDEALTKTEDFR